MTSMHNPETFLQVSSKEMFYLLGSSSMAADHFGNARNVGDLRMALYENMHLLLDPNRTTPWDARISFQCPNRDVKTYRDMQRQLDLAAARIGNIRFMYSPGGLSYINDGMTDAQQRLRLEAVRALGFALAAMPTVKSADAAAA